MLSKKSIFKTLIISSWVLTAASLVAWQLHASQLPDLLQQYEQSLEEAPHQSKDDVLLVVGIITFIAFIVSNVGLFRLRKWARPLYLYSYAALMSLVLIDGQPSVGTAIEEFFSELAMLTDGAIIALAYFPPVTDEFH